MVLTKMKEIAEAYLGKVSGNTPTPCGALVIALMSQRTPSQFLFFKD